MNEETKLKLLGIISCVIIVTVALALIIILPFGLELNESKMISNKTQPLHQSDFIPSSTIPHKMQTPEEIEEILQHAMMNESQP
jgi:hypothetical protein